MRIHSYPVVDSKSLLDISHISRGGSSLRITLPKKVIKAAGLEPSDIVAFYLEGEKVLIERIRKLR